MILLIFAVITSCSKSKYQILFIRGKEAYSLGENLFEEYLRNLDFEFDSVILNNEEEFLEYLSSINQSKIKDNIFVISEKFSNSDIENEFNNSNYVYINGVLENRNNLKIDTKYVSYLLGAVSGMVTRSNSVSVIYSDTLKDYDENFSYYAEGIRRVNLRAYDLILNNENVLNLSLSADKVLDLKNFLESNSSDVVFYLGDNSIEVFDDSLKMVFTLNKSINNSFIDIFYDYGSVFEEIIKNLNTDFYKDYVISIKNNNISFNLDNLPLEIAEIFDNILSEILSGNLEL